MTLVFENPGEIDPRAAVTFGVNVKEGESPIGFFGTGLKYGIATVLRLGGTIEIFSGLRTHRFEARPTTIRGKEFGLVYMISSGVADEDEQPLGFTTDVGKAWEPWMAYRELRSNALDENGDAYAAVEVDRVGVADRTRIIVDCPAIEEAHANGREYFLRDRGEDLLFTVSGICEVYAGSSNYVFYRGIRVHELEKPSLYTYNVLTAIDLTEDRLAKNGWEVMTYIRSAIVQSTHGKFIEDVLTAGRNESFEGRLDYEHVSYSMKPSFISATASLSRNRIADLNPSAYHAVRRLVKEEPVPRTPSKAELDRVATGVLTLTKMGYPIGNYPIVHVENLGEGILGLAADGKIHLSKLAFADPDPAKMDLEVTLLEEWAHLHTGFKDYSRQLQDWLVREIIRVGLGRPVAAVIAEEVPEPPAAPVDDIPF